MEQKYHFQNLQEGRSRRNFKNAISFGGREDKLIWIHSKDGRYSVRSCYKFLMSKRDQGSQHQSNKEEPSAQEDRRSLWTSLWKLNLKHKLKIFIWKCINNILPRRENIFTRTHQGSPVCKECGEEMETTEHIFLQCSKAQLIRKLAPIQWDGATGQQGSFKRW